jgi:hypothetical protein
MVHRQVDENGYVLISALWLLVLSAAVVATILARNAEQARSVRSSALDLQRQLDFEAAAETIVADLVLRGGGSQWSQLPSAGTVTLHGRTIATKLSSESGRLDLNAADLAIIDRALQGLGASGTQRAEFVSHLKRIREKQEKFRYFPDDVGGISESVGLGCAADVFTVYSGLSQPDETQIDHKLAGALHRPVDSGFQKSNQRQGEAVRMILTHADGAKVRVVVRIGGIGKHAVLGWNTQRTCT